MSTITTVYPSSAAPSLWMLCIQALVIQRVSLLIVSMSQCATHCEVMLKFHVKLMHSKKTFPVVWACCKHHHSVQLNAVYTRMQCDIGRAMHCMWLFYLKGEMSHLWFGFKWLIPCDPLRLRLQLLYHHHWCDGWRKLVLVALGCGMWMGDGVCGCVCGGSGRGAFKKEMHY